MRRHSARGSPGEQGQCDLGRSSARGLTAEFGAWLASTLCLHQQRPAPAKIWGSALLVLVVGLYIGLLRSRMLLLLVRPGVLTADTFCMPFQLMKLIRI